MKKIKILLSISIFMTLGVLKVHASSQLDSIQHLIEQSEYEKALILIKNSKVDAKQPVEYYLLKGRALKGLFDFNNAINSYLKALTYYPDNNLLIIELANTYKQIPDYNNSLKYFELALKNDSSNRNLQIENANCKYSLELYSAALNDFSKIYRANTNNAFVAGRLASCYAKTEQPDSSIYYYRKAIQLNPLDANSTINICNQLIRQKRYAEAITISGNYTALDSSHARINSLIAYLYLLDNKYNQSVSKFNVCMNNGDTSIFVLKHIGISYFKLNNYETAKYYLERAYLADTSDINTLHFLGISCSQATYKKLGVNYLEKAAMSYTPMLEEYGLIYRNLAEACRSWSNCPCDKTIATCIKAFELNPKESILLNFTGICYDQCKKDKEKAIEYYARFLATKPASAKADKIEITDYTVAEGRLIELKKQLKNTSR